MKANIRNIFLFGLVFLLGLTACSPAATASPAQTVTPVGPAVPITPAPTQTGEDTVKTPAQPGVELVSNQPRITDATVSQDDIQQLVSDNTAFATALYQQLRGQDGNLFFSPYSISLALAMTASGANNDTATQMADTLHFSRPAGRLNPAFNALDQSLEGGQNSSTKGGFKLDIANSIWAQHDFDFLPAFLDTLAQYYGSGIYPVDFQDSETVRQQINQWVADQTANKIQDLIPQGAIDPMTRLVLANAIYFKAAWQYPFDKSQTAPADFTLAGGSTIQTPTMHVRDSLTYLKSDGYQAVEMPYAGGNYAMIAVMPDAGSLGSFEQSLTADQIQKIRDGLQPAEVTLSMPSFKIESSFGLSDTLKALGMTDAFDPSAADFSKMDGRQDLYINNVVHKAYVNVDEDGTEAAAATGVVAGLTSMMANEVTVTLDHPFIFMILDNTSGSVLFMGRMENPGTSN